MKEVIDKHIELVEFVNNAKTVREHELNEEYLNGFRMAYHFIGNPLSLIACDKYYIDKGIDRPMFGGVFLDWEPCSDE